MAVTGANGQRTDRSSRRTGRSSTLRHHTGWEAWRAVWTRRWPLAVAAFLVPATAAFTFATWLPPVYRSAATVLVDRQPVAENLAKGAVTTDLETRLRTISEEILSGSLLSALVERLDLYRAARRRLPPRQVADIMRKDIDVEVRSADPRGPGAATVAFTVGYRGPDREKVALVANTLAGLYVERNAVVRDRQVTGTAALLEGRIAEARRLFETAEQRLLEFRRLHATLLPEQQPLNLAVLEQVRAQLRLNAASQARVRQVLPPAPAGAPEVDSVDSRLARLRQERVLLLTQYGERYPDVVRVNAEIAALELQLGGHASPSLRGGPAPARPVDHELAALQAEERALKAEIAAYEQRVLRGATTERELQALVAHYENARQQYRSRLERHDEIQLAETMAHERKNEQFRVLDPAVPAARPSGPNRTALVAFGWLLGLGASIAAVLAAERLDGSVRSANELRAFSSIPIAGRIPLIAGESDRRRYRRRFVAANVGLLLALAAVSGGSYVLARGNAELAAMLTGARK
jgi:succinoglycan biosynthesis transport protein ExoP